MYHSVKGIPLTSFRGIKRLGNKAGDSHGIGQKLGADVEQPLSGVPNLGWVDELKGSRSSLNTYPSPAWMGMSGFWKGSAAPVSFCPWASQREVAQCSEQIKCYGLSSVWEL